MPGTAFRRCADLRPPRPDDLAEARRQVLEAALVGTGQSSVRREVLAFLDSHADALLRSCTDGHLTGSALVVDRDRQRFVLLHHRKLGRWLQPGGHADGDGDLAGVALREAAEETGLDDLVVVTPAIDIDVHRIPARGEDPSHLHLDLRFVVLCGSGADPVVNHESHDVRWVARRDLERYGVEDELRRLVDRALEVASLV